MVASFLERFKFVKINMRPFGDVRKRGAGMRKQRSDFFGLRFAPYTLFHPFQAKSVKCTCSSRLSVPFLPKSVLARVEN